jgi:hypothetical protein
VPIQQNKFARRLKEREEKKPKAVPRDTQLTPDEQLGRLEEDIRRLKVEFDIYFNGAARRPPYDTKGRVDTIIKRLADDRTLSFAQRYRYNSLVARHTSFIQLWRRTLQDREEGRRGRRAPHAAIESTMEPVTFCCANPHKDVATVKLLFQSLCEAKKICGESTEDLSFPRFHRMVAEKTDTLKERAHCEVVRFSIGVEGGRVKFKARPEM